MKHSLTVALLFLGAAILGLAFEQNAIHKNVRENIRTEESKSVFADPIPLPKNDFDATSTIPGTSISFSYPKNGFYGWGIRYYEENAAPDDPFHFLGGVGIVPNVDPQNKDYLTELYLGSYSLPQNQTLRGAIDKNSVKIIAVGDAKNTGSYVTINGHEFFIYKDIANTQFHAWHAFSFGKKEIVSVIFQFMPGDDAFSQTAFRNDDQLFFQILSHLKFD